MAQAAMGNTMIEAPVLDLLNRERAKALSPREWKFRLAGYGYSVRDVDGGQMVSTLPHGVELGILPTIVN